jgi:hypothetical protein
MSQNTPEINEMLKLGEAVFLEGVKKLSDYKAERDQFIHKRHELIIKKRLAVVEFTNGLELILKAILVKNGYCIYNQRRYEIFLSESKVNDTIDEERTIDLSQVVEYFKNKHSELPFDNVNKLRKIRNQIVHKGTNIDEKKMIYFINAIDCLNGLYYKEDLHHKKFLDKINNARISFFPPINTKVGSRKDCPNCLPNDIKDSEEWTGRRWVCQECGYVDPSAPPD